MQKKIIFGFLILILQSIILFTNGQKFPNPPANNLRPIIGIMTEPTMDSPLTGNYYFIFFLINLILSKY